MRVIATAPFCIFLGWAFRVCYSASLAGLFSWTCSILSFREETWVSGWNTSCVHFTAKFKTTNVSLGEEVATVPSKSVGLICRLKHFDVHTGKISDGLMVNCATPGWAQGWYVSISRQTSPPTSSQKVWFTSSPVGCVELYRCVVPVCIRLCESYVCHTRLSALRNRGERVVRVGLRLPMSFIRCVHTCLLWLAALWRMEMSMRLFTAFVPVSSERGLVRVDALPSYIYSDHTGQLWGWGCREIKTYDGFCLRGATQRPNF